MPQIEQLPQELVIIIGAVLLVAALIAFSAITTAQNARRKKQQKSVELAEANGKIELLEDQLVEYYTLKNKWDLMLEDKTRAVSENESSKKRLAELEEEKNRALAAQREAEGYVDEIETKLVLSAQANEADKKRMAEKEAELKTRMEDWQKQREESVISARAAVMKAGSEMSSKLLEDHKRESVEIKKQQTEQVKETTQKLMEKFSEVTQKVAAIRGTADQARTQMDTVMRALTNPTGAGQMAEVGLENLLKNFGLVEGVGRDFMMQYHISGEHNGGNTLRPDAVVFLPQDMVIVVDSKASKHLIELAEQTTPEGEATMMAGLKKTMNEHLRTLASKNYKDAVINSIKSSGDNRKVGHILNVMYVPSESTVEKIFEADKDFHNKLAKADILLTGPSGLFSIFQLAREQIASASRDENNEQIIEVVSQLMESVAVAFTHADKMGKSLKSSMDNFGKFASSINSNLLPKTRKLNKLGVTPSKGKELPLSLNTYDVHPTSNTLTIEAGGNNASENKVMKINALEDG